MLKLRQQQQLPQLQHLISWTLCRSCDTAKVLGSWKGSDWPEVFLNQKRPHHLAYYQQVCSLSKPYVCLNSAHMNIVMNTAGLYMDGKYKYSGEWNKDRMHGTGKFIYASGTTYDGQWDNSEYHGTGTFSWPDGRHYEVQAKSVRV